MFCCTLLYVHSSIAIILMGKREQIALLNLSSWCLVMVERLFLAVPRGSLQFVKWYFLIILPYYSCAKKECVGQSEIVSMEVTFLFRQLKCMKKMFPYFKSRTWSSGSNY